MRNKTGSGLRATTLQYLNQSHNIHNYEMTSHNSLSVDDIPGREQDKAESTERGPSPANCPARTHHKVQGTNVTLRWTAACSNRGFTHTTQSVGSLFREHKALGVMRRKWLNMEFSSLEIFNANTNPWNLSGWTCFVQGFNRAISFQPQIFCDPSIFHSNTISLIKREPRSAPISVRLLKGKKITFVSRNLKESSGLFWTLQVIKHLGKYSQNLHQDYA